MTFKDHNFNNQFSGFLVQCVHPKLGSRCSGSEALVSGLSCFVYRFLLVLCYTTCCLPLLPCRIEQKYSRQDNSVAMSTVCLLRVLNSTDSAYEPPQSTVSAPNGSYRLALSTEQPLSKAGLCFLARTHRNVEYWMLYIMVLKCPLYTVIWLVLK